jgi:branched-chain amino acid transport system substrate-binding protein
MRCARFAPLALLLIAAGIGPPLGSAAAPPIEIGAVYPTGGAQGPGGLAEFHGTALAADYVNGLGGVRGRPVRLRLVEADSYDAAPDAVDRLADDGVSVVIGSYGSTISRPAAEAASKRGLVFWETGAVGELSMRAAAGRLVFRVSPTGGALGRAAAAFVRDQLAPRLRRARALRYGVTYVDDVYGRAVGLGAVDEIRRSRLPLAGVFAYDARRVRYDELARRVAASGADVLVVAAYLEDGVALRRTLVAEKVPLVANIGTSSSYCMPEFGRLLGRDAVGVFASDKPDGAVLHPDRLAPDGARALRWGTAEYRRRYGEPMSAPALAGFAGGLALFQYALPHAQDVSATHVADAARTLDLPVGTLPNGSGVAFAPPGTPEAGANLRALSVIWEWVAPDTSAVVWPASFATHAIVFH